MESFLEHEGDVVSRSPAAVYISREEILSKIKTLGESFDEKQQSCGSQCLPQGSASKKDEIKKLIRMYFWSSIIDFDKIKNKLGPQHENIINEVFQEFIQK